MSFICVICCDLLKISDDNVSEEASSSSSSPLRFGHNHHHHNNNGGALCSPSKAKTRKGRNKSIVATKCGHLFHYSCLSVWLSQSVNLTCDSKMRCPSCKQLIYIYELIQLFPVESGCSSSDCEQRLKDMLNQLDLLCRDLSRKTGTDTGSPLMLPKGNETPTKLQRILDSPKKSQAHQLAQLMKDVESIRSSIKDLNVCMEQQKTEMGSRLEKQTKQISELRSKNEELLLANERLKSQAQHKTQETEQALVVLTACRNNQDCDDDNSDDKGEKLTNEEEVCGSLQKNGDEKTSEKPTKHGLHDETNNTDSSKSCSSRRKSVTFLDPFDPDFGGNLQSCEHTHTTIPYSETHFRVGDKIVWHFEGNPEVGTVKWKGFIGSQINVGVEFERQLGLPIKDLSNDALQCIFKCKPGHGRLIPVREVELYRKTMGGSSLSSGECSTCEKGTKRVHMCAHQ